MLLPNDMTKKILIKAKKEFLLHGFEKASIRVIAKNAGVTTGALYTRFKSKDELFSCLVKPFAEEFIRIGAQWKVADEELRQRKLRAGNALTEHIYANKDTFKLLFSSVRTSESLTIAAMTKGMGLSKNSTIMYDSCFRLFDYCVLVFLFLSILFGVLPYITLSNIAVALIEGSVDGVNYILIICAVIFGALALKAITMGIGPAHSHTATFVFCHNFGGRYPYDVYDERWAEKNAKILCRP